MAQLLLRLFGIQRYVLADAAGIAYSRPCLMTGRRADELNHHIRKSNVCSELRWQVKPVKQERLFA